MRENNKEIHYCQDFDRDISIVIRINRESDEYTAIMVYAIFKTHLVGRPRRVGHAYTNIKHKIAELEDLKVEQPYRRKGLGGSMLRLIIAYLKDENITEFFGHANDAEDLEIAKKFYTKTGFSIREYFEFIEQTDVYMTLSKPKQPEFFSLNNLRQITRDEYERSI